LVRDPMLDTAYQDLEQLRDNLQQAQERIFDVGLYMTIYADNTDELNKLESEVKSILESQLVYVKPAIFQQEAGFNSVIPIAQDLLGVYSKLNTSPLSSLFPFISFDLTTDKGILYGINRHNSSLVLFDRFSLENYNSVIFAKAGAGKSFAVKLEILRSLMFDTDIIVIDPEREYEYLAEATGGRYFNISLTSENHINPFDLPMPGEDEAPSNVLRSKIVNLVGLFRIMLGGLTPEEDAIIDRAITETYALKDITPESDFSQIEPPLLSDFELVLAGMEGAESLVQKLSKYTKGTWEGFINRPTNIDINRKFIVFSIRDMEDELKPVAMYLVTDFIWNAIRRELKKRLLVIDEAWWMMKSEDTASFLFGLAKRGRKYYLGISTITQDVEDFLRSPYGLPIITNSSIQLLMKQSPSSIDMVQQTFNLTEEEKYLLLESDVGEGIFFAGLKHVAIKIIASYTEEQIITSDPSQVLAIKKAKEEFRSQ
jgi:conjugal transfer ATP-binding protein TraC